MRVECASVGETVVELVRRRRSRSTRSIPRAGWWGQLGSNPTPAATKLTRHAPDNRTIEAHMTATSVLVQIGAHAEPTLAVSEQFGLLPSLLPLGGEGLAQKQQIRDQDGGAGGRGTRAPAGRGRPNRSEQPMPNTKRRHKRVRKLGEFQRPWQSNFGVGARHGP